MVAIGVYETKRPKLRGAGLLSGLWLRNIPCALLASIQELEKPGHSWTDIVTTFFDPHSGNMIWNCVLRGKPRCLKTPAPTFLVGFLVRFPLLSEAGASGASTVP